MWSLGCLCMLGIHNFTVLLTRSPLVTTEIFSERATLDHLSRTREFIEGPTCLRYNWGHLRQWKLSVKINHKPVVIEERRGSSVIFMLGFFWALLLKHVYHKVLSTGKGRIGFWIKREADVRWSTMWRCTSQSNGPVSLDSQPWSTPEGARDGEG